MAGGIVIAALMPLNQPSLEAIGASITPIVQQRGRLALHRSIAANLDMAATWTGMMMEKPASRIQDIDLTPVEGHRLSP